MEDRSVGNRDRVISEIEVMSSTGVTILSKVLKV
jgi:hypothetical protein